MNPKIIYALDIPELDQRNLEIVNSIKNYTAAIKVGLELFTSSGFDVLSRIDHPIFLDLKLHDIPETVSRTIEIICKKFTPRFLTIHISQEKTIKRALEITNKYNVTILGVTVLTSISNYDLLSLGSTRMVTSKVKSLLEKSYEWGLRGFVSSGHELVIFKNYPDTIKVVPGIRSTGKNFSDQKRVITPREAITSGANYLVIGRQIRDAEDPLQEIKNITTEINDVNSNVIL